MARISKVETCMICGDSPCTCGRKMQGFKAKKQPKSRSNVDVQLPVESKSFRDAMKATALAKPVLKPVKIVHQKVETPVDDLLLADAIRNLAPILHPDELEKYKILITSQPSAAERAVIWRARRNEES